MKKLRENAKGIGLGTIISAISGAATLYLASRYDHAIILYDIGCTLLGTAYLLFMVYFAATATPDNTFQRQNNQTQ